MQFSILFVTGFLLVWTRPAGQQLQQASYNTMLAECSRLESPFLNDKEVKIGFLQVTLGLGAPILAQDHYWLSQLKLIESGKGASKQIRVNQ